MATPNGYTYRHNRTYIYLNPQPFLGPYTQRLSNIPAESEPPSGIENLYTFAPMAHTEGANTANLYFDIIGIPDYARTRAQIGIEKIVDNTLKYAPFKSQAAFSGLQTITGIKPVYSSQVGTDAALWFEIEELPDIDSAREKRRMNIKLNLPYNSKSIDSLSASAPVKVYTDAGDATVSIDFTLLPDA